MSAINFWIGLAALAVGVYATVTGKTAEAASLNALAAANISIACYFRR